MQGITSFPWKRSAWILSALLVAGALAGCAEEPEEADGGPIEAEEPPIAEEPPVVEEPVVDENETAEQDQERQVDNVVIIDNAVYECDTFAEIGDVEGRCDEYQLIEGTVDQFPQAQTFQSTNDTVVINGTSYVCDDDLLEIGTVEDEPVDETAANETGAVDEDEFTGTTTRCQEYVLPDIGE